MPLLNNRSLRFICSYLSGLATERTDANSVLRGVRPERHYSPETPLAYRIKSALLDLLPSGQLYQFVPFRVHSWTTSFPIRVHPWLKNPPIPMKCSPSS